MNSVASAGILVSFSGDFILDPPIAYGMFLFQSHIDLLVFFFFFFGIVTHSDVVDVKKI